MMQIVPHEFTGPVVNGEHICRYCFGTPRECQFVFGPHCEKAAEANPVKIGMYFARLPQD